MLGKGFNFQNERKLLFVIHIYIGIFYYIISIIPFGMSTYSISICKKKKNSHLKNTFILNHIKKAVLQQSSQILIAGIF